MISQTPLWQSTSPDIFCLGAVCKVLNPDLRISGSQSVPAPDCCWPVLHSSLKRVEEEEEHEEEE